MEINATFLIAAVSFILFVIIMNFIFYKPIEKIVNEREKFVDGNFDEAQKNNLNSEKLTKEHEQKLEEANFKGKTIMDEKSEEAKKTKASIISEAQHNVAKKIHDNQTDLAAAFDNTKEALKSDMENLANEMSKKLFGET